MRLEVPTFYMQNEKRKKFSQLLVVEPQQMQAKHENRAYRGTVGRKQQTSKIKIDYLHTSFSVGDVVGVS